MGSRWCRDLGVLRGAVLDGGVPSSNVELTTHLALLTYLTPTFIF